MNGCCQTHCDSSGHDLDCSHYWPCGCRKAKGQREHTHVYRMPKEIEWEMPDWNESERSSSLPFDTYDNSIGESDDYDSRSDLMPTILDDAD